MKIIFTSALILLCGLHLSAFASESKIHLVPVKTLEEQNEILYLGTGLNPTLNIEEAGEKLFSEKFFKKTSSIIKLKATLEKSELYYPAILISEENEIVLRFQEGTVLIDRGGGNYYLGNAKDISFIPENHSRENGYFIGGLSWVQEIHDQVAKSYGNETADKTAAQAMNWLRILVYPLLDNIHEALLPNQLEAFCNFSNVNLSLSDKKTLLNALNEIFSLSGDKKFLIKNKIDSGYLRFLAANNKIGHDENYPIRQLLHDVKKRFANNNNPFKKFEAVLSGNKIEAYYKYKEFDRKNLNYGKVFKLKYDNSGKESLSLE